MTLFPTNAPNERDATPAELMPVIHISARALDAIRAAAHAEGLEAAARWHDSEAERLRSTSTEVAAYIALMRAVHMESAAATRQSKEP